MYIVGLHRNGRRQSRDISLLLHLIRSAKSPRHNRDNETGEARAPPFRVLFRESPAIDFHETRARNHRKNANHTVPFRRQPRYVRERKFRA